MRPPRPITSSAPASVTDERPRASAWAQVPPDRRSRAVAPAPDDPDQVVRGSSRWPSSLDTYSGDRTSQPPFRTRKLNFEWQRSGDIKVPKGGLSPLAPTRTSVLWFCARAVRRQPLSKRVMSHRRTSVSWFGAITSRSVPQSLAFVDIIRRGNIPVGDYAEISPLARLTLRWRTTPRWVGLGEMRRGPATRSSGCALSRKQIGPTR